MHYVSTGDCGDPGPLVNAVRRGTTGPFPLDTLILYTCKAGFCGRGSIICEVNESWTPLPNCTSSGTDYYNSSDTNILIIAGLAKFH